MDRHTITVLVKNTSGVLTRISGLFSRRGYNIDSLAVCATEDEKFSRMTIAARGEETTIEQIIKQLDKLEDVIKVMELNKSESVIRELALIKIKAQPKERPEIESTCNIYKAKTVDLSPDSLIIELTGDPTKIDAFVKVLEPYGIIELTRTGITALSRGMVSINDLVDYNDLIK